MNRVFLIVFLLLLFSGLLALLGIPNMVQALPEYSSQTGEPCASCHLSPSGGGPRGARGQAWVGSGKPSSVPSMVESLELLGVELDVDPEEFKAEGKSVPPAQPPQRPGEQTGTIDEWLRDFQGN